MKLLIFLWVLTVPLPVPMVTNEPRAPLDRLYYNKTYTIIIIIIVPLGYTSATIVSFRTIRCCVLLQ